MTNRYSTFLCTCLSCGAKTNKAYARNHEGKCKSCAEPESRVPSREARIIDSGWQAYAREEGHYDTPDCY